MVVSFFSNCFLSLSSFYSGCRRGKPSNQEVINLWKSERCFNPHQFLFTNFKQGKEKERESVDSFFSEKVVSLERQEACSKQLKNSIEEIQELAKDSKVIVQKFDLFMKSRGCCIKEAWMKNFIACGVTAGAVVETLKEKYQLNKSLNITVDKMISSVDVDEYCVYAIAISPGSFKGGKSGFGGHAFVIEQFSSNQFRIYMSYINQYSLQFYLLRNYTSSDSYYLKDEILEFMQDLKVLLDHRGPFEKRHFDLYRKCFLVPEPLCGKELIRGGFQARIEKYSVDESVKDPIKNAVKGSIEENLNLAKVKSSVKRGRKRKASKKELVDREPLKKAKTKTKKKAKTKEKAA